MFSFVLNLLLSASVMYLTAGWRWECSASMKRRTRLELASSPEKYSERNYHQCVFGPHRLKSIKRVFWRKLCVLEVLGMLGTYMCSKLFKRCFNSTLLTYLDHLLHSIAEALSKKPFEIQGRACLFSFQNSRHCIHSLVKSKSIDCSGQLVLRKKYWPISRLIFQG